MIDVATDISNGVYSTTENETQTDMFNVRNKCKKYILIIYVYRYIFSVINII